MKMKRLTLFMLVLMIFGFASCEMPVNNTAVSGNGLAEEGYAEDLTSEINPDDFLLPEYSSSTSRGIKGIGDTKAKTEIGAFIQQWIDAYVTDHSITGYLPYQYIDMVGQGQVSVPYVSTSEAMGYGLRLLCYKYSLNKDFNAIYSFWHLYRTIDRFTFNETNSADGLINSFCNWYIPTDFSWQTVLDDAASDDPTAGPATDGDLDIAYGLILGAQTYRQYVKDNPSLPSRGKRFYKKRADFFEKEALKYIRGIAINYYGTAYVNNQKRNYLNIAPHDWENAAGLTRPSDWMPHHLATFYDFYNEFGPAANKAYYTGRIHDLLLGTLAMIEENKWGNGFFPDFIIFDKYVVDPPWSGPKTIGSGPGNYRALKADDPIFEELGEDIVPNHLSWNACRVPWRLSEYTAFHSGRHRARVRSIVEKMRYHGFKPFSGVANMGSGYDENWNIVESKYSPAFASPGALTMKAMRVTSRGAYYYKMRILKDNYNVLIDQFIGAGEDGYYEDSINAFSLLLMNDLMPRPEF